MSAKRHVLKVLGLAVMASLAISAFAVASAQAYHWTIEGATLANGTSETVSAGLKTGTTAKLEGKVLTKNVVLTATELVSIEGKIEENNNTEAVDSGFLEFKSVTVDEPAGCSVKEGKVKTNKLLTKLEEVDGTLYDHFFPETGTTFANVVISGCSIAGTYPVKGSEFGLTEPLGTELVTQPLTFSPAILAAATGSLTLGTEPAKLTAEGVNVLSGANAGKKFGAEN